MLCASSGEFSLSDVNTNSRIARKARADFRTLSSPCVNMLADIYMNVCVYMTIVNIYVQEFSDS